MSKIRVNQIETLDGLNTKDVATLIDDINNAAVTTSTGEQTLTEALDSRVIYVDTIDDLQALDASGLVDGQAARIGATERAGDFTWGVGDFSSEVSSDPERGVYVPPVSQDGSQGAWVRVVDGPLRARYFGASVDLADNANAVQAAVDYVLSKGKGEVSFDEMYSLGSPVSVNKSNFIDRVNVIFSGSGGFRKGEAFSGDRLITLRVTNSDEDNIVFSGLTFDGVNKDINGVDWFSNETPYTDNPIEIEDSFASYAKAIKFITCNFNRCYRGSRVSGNSNSFIGCSYRENVCGTFNTAAANDIRYIACSFRRGVVGAHIKTASASLGTVSTKFESCIFESNTVTGLALEDRPNRVKIGGFYFENNGFDLTDTSYSTSMSSPSKACHIYTFGAANGSGFTTVDTGEFWPSPSGVIDIFGPKMERFTVINSSPRVEATGNFFDTSFIGTTEISKIDVTGATTGERVTVNGKLYYTSSTGLREDAYDGENFSLGAGAGATVIKTETSDNGTFLIHTSTFTNSVAVFLAHRGTSTVTEISAAGSQTQKPSIAWNGDNLEATPGSSVGSRLNVVRVTRT